MTDADEGGPPADDQSGADQDPGDEPTRQWQATHLALTDNDHRGLGDFRSRYTKGAWVQILIELGVLLVYLGLAVYGVGFALWNRENPAGPLVEHWIADTLPWSGMFFAGVAGGTLFALKFLYHTVAKNEWNQDRVLWRFIVPISSGVLATCSGFGITSGIIPFVDQDSFGNIYTALFYGFFIGHFSDNVLAALHRLALQWFGTVDRSAHDATALRPPEER